MQPTQFKQQVIDEIIRIEGGYVNDPFDSGGETNFGITKSVARSFGYTGAMRNMPRSVAYRIYSSLYFDSVRADELTEISEKVAVEIVDTGVNMGVKHAGTFLQRCLNVLNIGGTLYNDLKVDGIIGPATINALAAYVKVRDEKELLVALNCLQGARYIELAERREKDEKFVYGWIKKRVVL